MRRRQTFACSRCYKKKKRCDTKLPACNNCADAGVQCLSIDRESENDIPRRCVLAKKRVATHSSATKPMTVSFSTLRLPSPSWKSNSDSTNDYLAPKQISHLKAPKRTGAPAGLPNFRHLKLPNAYQDL